MKKFLIGAFLIMALVGCSDSSSIITDIDGQEESIIAKELVETDSCLVSTRRDNDVTRIYYNKVRGGYYVMDFYSDGEPEVGKFKTLNEEIIAKSGYKIVKDNSAQIGLKIEIKPNDTLSTNSNIINNNIYVAEKTVKEPTKEELKKQMEENAKKLRIKELEEELDKLKNN